MWLAPPTVIRRLCTAATAPRVGVAVACFQGTLADDGRSVTALNPDNVLLVERARPPSAGEWTFPGGKLEFGEPLAAAGAREVLEETGLRVHFPSPAAAAFVQVSEVIFPPFHYVLVHLAGVVPLGCTPIAADDVAAAEWCDVAALHDGRDGRPLAHNTPTVLHSSIQCLQQLCE